jgi:hypothetical protein
MGKHDTFGHALHIPKQVRLDQQKPSHTFMDQRQISPAIASQKTNSMNRYLNSHKR